MPQINAAYAEIAENLENVFLAGDIHPTEQDQAALAEIGLDALVLD